MSLLAIGGATVVGGIGSDIVDIVGLQVGHIAGESAVALPHGLMVTVDGGKVGGAPADAAFGDVGAAVGSDIASAGGAGGRDIGNIGSGDGRQIKTSSFYCYLVAAIVGDHMQDGAIGSTSQAGAVNGHCYGDGLTRRDGVGDVGHRGNPCAGVGNLAGDVQRTVVEDVERLGGDGLLHAKIKFSDAIARHVGNFQRGHLLAHLHVAFGLLACLHGDDIVVVEVVVACLGQLQRIVIGLEVAELVGAVAAGEGSLAGGFQFDIGVADGFARGIIGDRAVDVASGDFGVLGAAVPHTGEQREEKD